MRNDSCRGLLRSGPWLMLALAVLGGRPALADEAAPMSRAGLCINTMVNIPAPAGESDLKGNALLNDYCGCFAKAFEERAARRQAQGGPKPPPRQSIQEERDMRSACRAQFKLPPLQFRRLPN